MFLSTILRRLLTEKNPNCAEDLCQKLENAVLSQSNHTYICSSFEHLVKNMITILKECPKESLHQASKILGIIGYINRSNFPTYQNYLTEAYQSSKDIHVYIMVAIRTTLSYDVLHYDLLVYSERLLIILKDYLENAETAQDFIAVSSTIAEFSKSYKKAFRKHFTDIVDIIVGWHLETEQPQSLKLHCSNILQQLSDYFLNEMEFAFRLLGQFLEDIVVFGKENYDERYLNTDKNNYALKIASFIGAFTSIFKVLVSSTTITNIADGLSLINNMLLVLRNTVKEILIGAKLHEEFILNMNDLLCVVVTHCYYGCNFMYIEEMIQFQVRELQNFTEKQITSLLFVIFYIVRELGTTTPQSIVESIYRSNDGIFATIKLAKNNNPRILLLVIYRQILMTKNVPLLQDAYKHITRDIEACIETLETDVNIFSSKVHESQLKLSFYFSTLSALATQTSSIIGMYALNPSILELLITNCKAANMDLWCNYPSLQSALLKLLIIHCNKNRNFIPTSRLLNEQHFIKCNPEEKCSPTSENLSIILKYLSHILDFPNAVRCQSLDLLLDWTFVIIEGCIKNADILENNLEFVNICKSICDITTLAPIKCGNCIRALLRFTKLNKEVLLTIRKAAIPMIINSDLNIEYEYGSIYARLPLEISLSYLNELSIDSHNESKFNNLQDWYKSCPQFVKLRSKFFKYFMDTLDLHPITIECFDKYYLEIFKKCWIHSSQEKSIDYKNNVFKSSSMLLTWLHFEAARYCVSSKLRTVIGKPQDTFLFIEAVIMKYVQIFARKGSLDVYVTLDEVMNIQKKIRNLLGFIENLEKHIYNATEGTAFAILLPEKPSKTFFRINDHTCREWFKRIRTGIILIAVHSKQPEIAIHNSEEILKLHDTGNIVMDHVITLLVWALVSCEEPDTLYGLYNWLRIKSGTRYNWIQFVVEQISGRREKAVAGYLSILKDDKILLDPQIKEFLINQLLECMFCTGQFSEMKKYLNEDIMDEINTYNIYNARSTICLEVLDNIYKDYVVFEDNHDRHLIDKFANWKSSTEQDIYYSNLSYFNVLRNLENICFRHTLGVQETEIHKSTQLGLLKSLKEMFLNGITRSARNEADNFIILNHTVQKIIDCTENDIFSSYNFDTTFYCSTSIEKCFFWREILKNKHIEDVVDTKNETMYLLTIAKKARCDENYNFFKIILKRFFNLKGCKEPLKIICNNILGENFTLNINDSELLVGFYEMIKCIYTSSSNINNQLDAINLGSAYCFHIIKNMRKNSIDSYPTVCSEMLLTLADWLYQKNNLNVKAMQINRLLTELPEIAIPLHEKDNNALIPELDRAIGKLLYSSTINTFDFGDAWYAFGNWCYRWGKKLIETRSTKHYSQKKDITLNDLEAIQRILGENINEEKFDEIFRIFNNHEIIGNCGFDDIEMDLTNYCDSVESQLKTLTLFENKSSQQIENVIKIWRKAHKNIYGYYEMATRSYFKYLSIDSSNQQLHCVSECSSTYVTATLRILRLIVKHAIGLQEVLEEGFKTTPLYPWKIIIPQLFSRLNHHETYVRKSVSDLLYRLAQDTPHLVIFPTVVGANQEHEYNLESSYININEINAATINNCYSSLLLTLSELNPETVLHVQLLVKELKRIALLWEEYWMQALSQICGEYSFLFSSLENEYKRYGDSCSEVIKTKYGILMKHIVYDLERAANFTKRNAETNYERQFQERFNVLLKSTIDKLKVPLRNNKFNEGWIQIKELHNTLHQKTMRGSISTLRTCDLSPVLANMRNTSIAMPGIDTFAKNPIYIKAVDSTIFTLPTKTKPKKLSFYGSNGKKYTYLFKGLEDLHLDERIMQFLAISNTMMSRSNDPLLKTNSFKAHHYSVIPLGTQSGLISWVEGVTPLFAIYKKWQQREATLRQKQKPRTENDSNTDNDQLMSAPNANRPSEIFYQKLSPILAEYDVKITDSRKLWPLAALRRVLEKLMNDTPNYLLSKEIWCNSINAAYWRKSIRRYSVSIAVMSVIGYIIGLGDRHLDNILIKLSSGEIVHIDYNVCFEKGKTLRVPEKVPFRLTQNLEEALGITRIEGIFRLTCEHVLRTLRKEKETLLTLLEAFVYDPLVDWTINDECIIAPTRLTSAQVAASNITALHSSYEPKELLKFRKTEISQKKYDWKCGRQFIEDKYNEIKPKWFEYKASLEFTLKEARIQYSNLMKTNNAMHYCEEEKELTAKEINMLHKFKMINNPTKLNHNQKQSVLVTNTEQNSQAYIEKYHSSLQNILEFYISNILVNPNSSSLNDHRLQLERINSNALCNEFEIIKKILQSNNKKELYEESEKIQSEMEINILNDLPQITDLWRILYDYSSVMQYFPRSYLSTKRILRLQQLCSKIMSSQLESETSLCRLPILSKNDSEKLHIAMETIWKDVQSDLKTLKANFNKQKRPILNIEEVTSEINDYIIVSEENECALKYNMLLILHNVNEQFFNYETRNEKNLLEHQINYISMVIYVCEKVFNANYNDITFKYLIDLKFVLALLQKLISAWELRFIEEILHLNMLDDDEKLQLSLENIFKSKWHEEFAFTQPSIYSDILIKLVKEIITVFNEFESHLNQLHQMTLLIFELFPDGEIKKYIVSRDTLKEKLLIDDKLKFKTISEIFQNIRKCVFSIKENNVNNVYDIRVVFIPLIQYINHFQSKFLCGLTPLYVQYIYKKLDSVYVKTQKSIDEKILCSAKTHSKNYIEILQYNCLTKIYQMELNRCTQFLDHYRFVASAHYWMNENSLLNQHEMHEHIIYRKKLLSSISNAKCTLSAKKDICLRLEAKVGRFFEKVQNYFESISHLDNIKELRSKFTEMSNKRKIQLHSYISILSNFLERSEIILQCENFSEDSKIEIRNIIQILNDLNYNSLLYQNINLNCNAQNTNSHELCSNRWLDNCIDWLEQQSLFLNQQQNIMKTDQEELTNYLFGLAQKLQGFSDSPVRAELRFLLKTIIRSEKYTEKFKNEKTVSIMQIRELQDMIKDFFMKLSELYTEIAPADYFNSSNKDFDNGAHCVLKLVKCVDEEFKESVESLIKSYTTNTWRDSKNVSSLPNCSEKKSGWNATEQKRNAYAVSVWKKIRAKLEGRDPDLNYRSNVHEQIEFVIKEATSIDNLAVLYEGWTPWV